MRNKEGVSFYLNLLFVIIGPTDILCVDDNGKKMEDESSGKYQPFSVNPGGGVGVIFL